MAKGLKDTIEEIQKDMGKRIYETCLRGNLPENDSLLTKNDIVRLKRCIFAQGATNLPPITTHNVVRNKRFEIRISVPNRQNTVRLIFEKNELGAFSDSLRPPLSIAGSFMTLAGL